MASKTAAEPLQTLVQHPLFNRLATKSQSLLSDISRQYRLTFQETRLLIEITRDLEMWRTDCDIASFFPIDGTSQQINKAQTKRSLAELQQYWENQKRQLNSYPEMNTQSTVKSETITREKEHLGLGYCPVASPKTRCCNLMTLDAVENCGYGCSYCSIQSFYSDNKVYFDSSFAEKLHNLKIEPDKIYHIGTGQSSDSLMWGNSHGVLDALIEFARKHPNVILELKTKSDNIGHLLRVDFPANIICTWSLNTPAIIKNEELGSASLPARLEAARHIADKGRIIGFHFHPMVQYDRWEADYQAIFQEIQEIFKPDEVALISLGTLTYIKPVIKQIREKGGQSQILKMPLIETQGKLSYPDEIKLELFGHAYQSFSRDWQQKVFFYLCMEHQRFWNPVFGFEYESNEAFERAMKQSYLDKIKLART